MDYKRQQDLIFQEMEDKKRIAEIWERRGPVHAAVELHGIQMADLQRALRDFRALKRSTGVKLSDDEFLAELVALAVKAKTSQRQ
jgi:hypothetical protein